MMGAKAGWVLAVAVLAAVPQGAVPAAAFDQQSASRGISREQAIRIARGYGMVQIREVERDDGGWEISGRDHRGRSLEVKINRRGRVTDVDRGDDDDD